MLAIPVTLGISWSHSSLCSPDEVHRLFHILAVRDTINNRDSCQDMVLFVAQRDRSTPTACEVEDPVALHDSYDCEALRYSPQTDLARLGVYLLWILVYPQDIGYISERDVDPDLDEASTDCML